MFTTTDLMNLTLPMVFMGGLLGSSHCIGMCGGFAMTLGIHSGGWQRNFLRQSIYSIGRMGTYSVLGAFAGFLGFWANSQWHHFLNIQATLSLIAGVILIVQGLWHLGYLDFPIVRRISSGSLSGPVCQVARGFGGLIRSSGYASAFVAGVFTGFMPCGLVYANLGLAGGSASMLWGMLTMAAFGLGTVPLMLVAGMGIGLAGPVFRSKLMKIAAVCVFLTGCVTLSRAYTGFASTWQDGQFRANCAACLSESPSDHVPQPHQELLK